MKKIIILLLLCSCNAVKESETELTTPTQTVEQKHIYLQDDINVIYYNGATYTKGTSTSNCLLGISTSNYLRLKVLTAVKINTIALTSVSGSNWFAQNYFYYTDTNCNSGGQSITPSAINKNLSQTSGCIRFELHYVYNSSSEYRLTVSNSLEPYEIKLLGYCR